MSEIKLPTLPQGYSERLWEYRGELFTEGQMRAHSTTATEADRQARGKPVAWLVTGPYEKAAFADKSTAESYCKGLNSGFGSSAYSTSPLYLAPQPAASEASK